jgi:hypothetical protein
MENIFQVAGYKKYIVPLGYYLSIETGCAVFLLTAWGMGSPGHRGVDMWWCKRKTGLEFPVADIDDIKELYCFGLQPWDTQGNNEIHGGIDLVARYAPVYPAMAKVPIVCPSDARVERIIESVSGDGGATLVVVLAMNPYWYLVCNFEAQTSNPHVFEEQRRRIVVRERQKVKRGALIGELVVSDVIVGSYPHLHFGFFYKHPGDSLEYIYEHYLDIRRSDGTDLAPLTGPGSPWKPRDLGRETTFYCAYEYSTARAKSYYDSKPSKAANGDRCRCVCAYGSLDGNCGSCE